MINETKTLICFKILHLNYPLFPDKMLPINTCTIALLHDLCNFVYPVQKIEKNPTNSWLIAQLSTA